MVVGAFLSSSALLGQGQRPAQAAPGPLRIGYFQGLHRHCLTSQDVTSPLCTIRASTASRWGSVSCSMYGKLHLDIENTGL